MLKIIFYLGTSLTANLDARPRRMPGIPGLALGRNSPALLSSPRMPRGTGDFDEFHSVCFWVERLVFPHEITRDYRFLSLAHLSLSLAHAASVPAAYGRLLMTGITMSGSSYYRSSLFASFSAAFFFFCDRDNANFRDTRRSRGKYLFALARKIDFAHRASRGGR